MVVRQPQETTTRGLDKSGCAQRRVTWVVKGSATVPLEGLKEQVTFSLDTYYNSDIHLHIFEGQMEEGLDLVHLIPEIRFQLNTL